MPKGQRHAKVQNAIEDIENEITAMKCGATYRKQNLSDLGYIIGVAVGDMRTKDILKFMGGVEEGIESRG